jgi:membrane-bound lytic murein transglycosylase B
MKKQILTLTLLFAFCGYADASSLEENFMKKKDSLIKTLIKAQIDNARALFSDARLALQSEILQGGTVATGWEAVFTEESVDRGRQCVERNYGILSRVESQFGINKEILVSLFRVETNLGKNMGSYVVFNSLLTWCVSGYRRASWAEKELIAYLTLCREQEFDPFEIRGSTHGAFGLVQFVPSSFQKFAIDGNGDGRKDLFDFEDAMASSANYLKKNGWSNQEKQMKRALYAYNRDRSYVNAIIKYSKLIKPRGSKGRSGRSFLENSRAASRLTYNVANMFANKLAK